MNYKKLDKMITKYIILIAVLVMAVTHMSHVSTVFSWIWRGISNIVYGIMLAYIMNIVLVKIEKILTKLFPRLKLSIKRPIGVLITFMFVTIIMYTIISLIIPEILNASKVLADSIPVYASYVQDFLEKLFSDFPSIVESINEFSIDWKDLGNKLISFLTRGVTNIFYTSLNVMTVFTTGLVNTLMITVFSIYLLLDKERFSRFFKRVIDVFFKEKERKCINLSLDIVHESFTSFISGQCLEAIIIGVLCSVGMTFLNLPYALMVGTIVGATSLIPVFGAYFGGALSVFIVFTVSAKSAVIFLIFLVVLQQLESNLIYPRVVGTSVGLPSVLVIASVMIFGTLFGVPGMFVGVPVSASLYKLIKIFIDYKESKLAERSSYD